MQATLFNLITGAPGGFIFLSTSFAVDPGMGDHISHKINHSRVHPNAEAREARTSHGVRCIVLRAKRVRFTTVHFSMRAATMDRVHEA